jgi:hypothetical protein
MQTNIVRTVALLMLTVMSSRNVSGQVYEDYNTRTFQMNVTRASDDSTKITTIIYRDRESPVYVFVMRNGDVQSLTVDGRPVAAADLGRYQKVIDEIKVRVKIQEKRDREQADRDREQAGRDREQAGRDMEQSARDREQAERDRHQADMDRLQADREREQVVKNREQVERDREQADRDRQQADKDRDQAGRDQQQAERDREQAGRDREQAVRDREQAERDRKQAEEDRRMIEALRKDLVQDGVVKDREDLYDIKIDEDEVIVNGKRLPEALEKKYLAKYAKKGNRMQFHTSHKGGMNLDVEHDN